ncbi:serine acetyltransferase [Candidatus Blochmanniella floridana]|uniref:Serine acetyltransferase n=1 Tax=Blochmanniella floridana TaxID=203907 RepID=Q7VRK8_BLOFL|nr:serine acetyltransferase [Candidatus Blochmannia floridanus]
MSSNKVDIVWNNMIIEARLLIDSEPILKKFLNVTLLNHDNFQDALVYLLFKKLNNLDMMTIDLIDILKDIYRTNDIIDAAAQDICTIRLRDPSVQKYLTPFLYLKGFHALQAYRITNWLWNHNYPGLAMYLYNRISIIFNVDIHPAAKIGCGIMLDHATGVVIGETAVIDDNVSIMQSVTLGSTGKIDGNRHPKIKKGVLIGAGSIILGNIEIGCGSKIGAGSIVVHSVPPYSTVVGRPARLVQ